MSKQSKTIYEVSHKSEQILCRVAVTQESLSLLKVWILEQV